MGDYVHQIGVYIKATAKYILEQVVDGYTCENGHYFGNKPETCSDCGSSIFKEKIKEIEVKPTASEIFGDKDDLIHIIDCDDYDIYISTHRIGQVYLNDEMGITKIPDAQASIKRFAEHHQKELDLLNGYYKSLELKFGVITTYEW